MCVFWLTPFLFLSAGSSSFPWEFRQKPSLLAGFPPNLSDKGQIISPIRTLKFFVLHWDVEKSAGPPNRGRE